MFGGGNDVACFLFGQVGNAFTRSGDEDDAVVGFPPFLHLVGHFLRRDSRDDLLGSSHVVFGANQTGLLQEVCLHVLDILLVVRLIGILQSRTQAGQHVGLGAFQFGLGESVLHDALVFADDGLKSFLFHVGFGHHRHGVSGISAHHAAKAETCLQEGSVAALDDFGDATGSHRVVEALHQAVLDVLIGHRAVAVVLLVAEDADEFYARAGGFLVGREVEVGLFVRRHFKERERFGVFDGGDGREDVLNLLLHLGYVEIAHHGDGFQVGAIPFMIEVADGLGLEVLDDVQTADDVAHGIFGTFQHDAHLLFLDAACAVVARAILFGDDAALFVNVFFIEREVIAPVVEDEEASVDKSLVGHGHGADVIHRLVLCGVGIQVSSERDAVTLQRGNHAVAGEVLTAVEGHVLQEVGQTVLFVVLQQSAGIADDVEAGTLLRLFVVAKIIGDAVGQFSHQYFGVGRKHLAPVNLLGIAQKAEEEQRQEKEFSLHNCLIVKVYATKVLLFDNLQPSYVLNMVKQMIK